MIATSAALARASGVSAGAAVAVADHSDCGGAAGIALPPVDDRLLSFESLRSAAGLYRQRAAPVNPPPRLPPATQLPPRPPLCQTPPRFRDPLLRGADAIVSALDSGI